jgi:hypothetical protein
MDMAFKKKRKKSAYGVLARKHERGRSLGRHTRRWEDNTKMDLEWILEK